MSRLWSKINLYSKLQCLYNILFCSIFSLKILWLQMIELIFRRRKYTSSKFTNLSIESEKSIRPFKAVSLLKLMKDYSQNSTSAYTSSTAMQSVKDIQYVFVQHNLEDKSEKECSICKFLDSEGIFQVNYQIAMSDYVFKSKD